MNILADTHILLWSIYDDDKLSDKAKNYLIDGRNRFYYSLVSIWEVAIKNNIGKMPIPAEDLLEGCDEMGFVPLPLKKEHIIRLQSLSEWEHRDPFDRMLVAQAEAEKIHFLTEDKKILDYKSPCVL
ncbi:MAG: type II toxin-antitoxin system VapC family toxin [Lachnospiraceae bacterium]|nr:type II toxin-antitoxin system VapC family toxin [Lachnospiraceae bacterium]